MDEIKVLSLLFTSNVYEGNTIRVLNNLLNNLRQNIILNEAESKCIFFNDLDVLNCKGCLNCFKEGCCNQDNIDNFNKIRKLILNTDLLILGTPIYMNNVPGSFKKFIDRLSSWGHLMKLNSKPTILVITSGNNGIDFVCKYLFNILTLMGMNIIGLLQINNTKESQKEKNLIKNIIYRYKHCYYETTKKVTNTALESSFQKYIIFYENNNNLWYEEKYWNNIIKQKFKSYFDYVNYIGNEINSNNKGGLEHEND